MAVLVGDSDNIVDGICYGFGHGDLLARELDLIRSTGPVTVTFSDISFGTSMCLDLMSWVQEVHNAAIMMVARA